MPAMPHPTAAELKALILGQTEEASSLSLEEHLNGCSECQRLAADIPGDTLVELLRSEFDHECSSRLLSLAARL